MTIGPEPITRILVMSLRRGICYLSSVAFPVSWGCSPWGLVVYSLGLAIPGRLQLPKEIFSRLGDTPVIRAQPFRVTGIEYRPVFQQPPRKHIVEAALAQCDPSNVYASLDLQNLQAKITPRIAYCPSNPPPAWEGLSFVLSGNGCWHVEAHVIRQPLNITALPDIARRVRAILVHEWSKYQPVDDGARNLAPFIKLARFLTSENPFFELL